MPKEDYKSDDNSDQAFCRKVFGHVFTANGANVAIVNINLTDEEIIDSIQTFLNTGKIQNKSVDMDIILGQGGEGLVVKGQETFMGDLMNCAIKLAHYPKEKRLETQKKVENDVVFGHNFVDHLKNSNDLMVGYSVSKYVIRGVFHTIIKLYGEYFRLSSKNLTVRYCFKEFVAIIKH